MKTNRVSVGFDEREWQRLNDAVRIYYSHSRPDDRYILASERTRFIRHAIWAIAGAIIRDGRVCMPPACDLRHETEEETRERLGSDADRVLGARRSLLEELQPHKVIIKFPDRMKWRHPL